MKCFVFLLLCGAAHSLALPTCSQREYEKCAYHPDEFEYPESEFTDATLDKYCSVYLAALDCVIDLNKKCPNATFAEFNQLEIAARDSLIEGCDKNGSLRKKFLENQTCLKNTVLTPYQDCKLPLEMEEENRCEKLREFAKCNEDYIARKCGEDAKDVYINFHGRFSLHKLENCPE